jgi:pimeloyl-ACP methyl ester carboxylesterase
MPAPYELVEVRFPHCVSTTTTSSSNRNVGTGGETDESRPDPLQLKKFRVHCRQSPRFGSLQDGDVLILFVHGLSHWCFTWDDLFDAAVAELEGSPSGAPRPGNDGGGGSLQRDKGVSYAALAFDLFGRGWSDRPAGTMDPAYFVDQIDALLETLNVPRGVRVACVGHSLGGAISLAWAAAHPERAHSVFALAPAGLMPTTLGLRAVRTPLLGSVLVAAAFRVLGRRLITTGQDTDFAPDARDRAARVDRAQRAVVQSLDENAHVVPSVFACLREFPVDGLGDTLAAVACPVALVYGALDKFYGATREATAATVARYVDRMPHAEVTRFEGAAHAVHHEEPEAVARMLVEFLQQKPGKQKNGKQNPS